MGSNRTLANLSARSSPLLRMFSTCTGKLRRQLRKGEFALFKHVPVFESDFIQISKRGHVIDVHNSVQLVTVGIAFSNPSLAIPDVMLLARPAGSHAVSARHDRDTKRRGLKSAKSLELTRLFPLKFVKLSIHNREKKQLRLKLATGRSFYLQLCPPADAKEDLFAQWEDLLFFLRPPVEAYSGMQAEPAGDMMDIPLLEAEDRRSPEAMEVCGEGGLDQVSIRSIYMLTEVSGATSPAHATGEGVQPHASRTRCVLRSTDSVLMTAPVGPAPGTSSRGAVTPAGSRSVVAGAVVTSIPGRETLGGPGLRPSISALHRKDNTGEQDEGRRASQPQAEALRKRSKEVEAPTTSTSHSGRKWEDQSVLVSHGTTRGHQRDKGRSNLSIYEMGSRLSQKLMRSKSKTRTEGVP